MREAFRASRPSPIHDLRVFRTEEDAGEGCHFGDLRPATGVIYDRLDGTLVG